MKEGFYRSFEDRYRGSRDLIKNRLSVYAPFISPLLNINDAHDKSSAQAIDLGCGRGEWIELLRQKGFSPLGIDLDDGMLQACQALDLNVRKEDVLTAIRKLPNESQSLVSAFHLVEHLKFNQVQELIEEALRVLKPCGLLILETPNPENLTVGATSFYRDPTHERPIPPELLAFLPEFVGFKRTKIVRLQEDRNIIEGGHLTLYAVFHASSPDYAIIAQKNGPEDILSLFNPSFKREYGVTFGDLADRYHISIEERIGKAIALSQQAITIATERAEASELYVKQMQSSTSWRVTTPLRWTSEKLSNTKKNMRLIGTSTSLSLKHSLARSKLIKQFIWPILKRIPFVEVIVIKWLKPSIKNYSFPNDEIEMMSRQASRLEIRLKSEQTKKNKV